MFIRPNICSIPRLCGYTANFASRPSISNPFLGGCFPTFRPMMSSFPCAFPMQGGLLQYLGMVAQRLNVQYAQLRARQTQLLATFKRTISPTAKPTTSNYNFGTLTSKRNSNPYSSSTLGSLRASNSSFWSSIGYCASKGLKLARTALSNCAARFTGWCARYVKRAIAKCGLGGYVNGDAYQVIGILRKNKNFREISPRGIDPKTLPAGCVIVYGKGVSGYSSKYGHTEITTGDGRAVSDGITKNIRGNITAIFVPVA